MEEIRFTAVSEDGEEIVIIGYREQLAAGHMGDPGATIPRGLLDYKTEDGVPVTAKAGEDGVFLSDWKEYRRQ